MRNRLKLAWCLAVGAMAAGAIPGGEANAAPRDRYSGYSPFSGAYYRELYRPPSRLDQRLRPKQVVRRAPQPERAAAEPKTRPAALPTTASPAEPLTLVVSIGSQRLTVYSGTEQIARSSISSGTRGHETPTGVFSVIQKERMHYSNLYNDAPMPFMQRLTWSGIALHAGHLPGYPASHGCVRLPHEFARRLYGMTAMGARVIVTGGDPIPTSLSHQRLAALAAVRTTHLAASGEPAPAARLDPPMHLGLSAQDAATPPASQESNPSLLVKSQQHVAQRTLALETARVSLEIAARPLGEASQTLQQARDAVATGRGEAAKARGAVRRLESEVAAVEGRFRDLQRTAERAPDSAVATEDRLEASLERLYGELEAARKSADETDETLREIAEEQGQAEAQAIAARRAHEDAAQRLKIAEEDLKEARRDLVKRQRPVSLLVSRKTGKLYVRQGFDPLLEAQVSLDAPDTPVGTHVFTALAASPGGALRWSAVSVPSRAVEVAEAAPRRPGRAGRDEAAAAAPPARLHAITAAAALDRLQIGADVLAQIGDLIKPGSSLVITDEPLSRETGKHTDLIVQTR